jgi:hypothetical protein
MINDESKKIENILSYIDYFNKTLSERPAMLGTPYELNAICFYIDVIELIAKGYIAENFHGVSWMDFLIEKKHIVGANDLLRNRLKMRDDDYSEIQYLREEYATWRMQRLESK